MTKSAKKLLLLVTMTVTMMFAMCIMTFAGTISYSQTKATSSSVTVAWEFDTFSAPKYVRIQLCADPNFTNVSSSNNYTFSSSTANTVTFSGLTAGATYYVRFGGGSSYSGSYSYTKGFDVVTAPANMGTVSFATADDYSASISWAPVAGATGYIVAHNPAGSTVTYETTATSYKVSMTATSGTSALVYPIRKSSSGFKAVGNYGTVSNLSALTSKIATKDFGVDNFYSSTKKLSFGVASTALGQGFEVEVKPQKGAAKIVQGRKSYKYMTDNISYKKGVLYKYRVRMYVNTAAGKKYGQWSDYRNYATANSQKAKFGPGRVVKLRWKKIKGISKIVVKLSTSKNGKYTKVATLKGSATSVTLSKYKKKAFTNGKYYYYELHFYTKSGKKYVESDIIGTGSFRWYTRYI